MRKINYLIMMFAFFSCYLEATNEEQLKQIDKEIEQVTQELHAARIKMMHAETLSQNFIKYEWGDYSREIEDAEKYERQVEQLDTHLQQLLKEKEALKK